jgi:basic amino acid/polyamine antiporter, APA family
MQPSQFRLAKRLGSFDIGLIVVGSVIGSGIFRTPAVVAQRAPEASLVIVAWIAGGIIALFGAFVLGELAARHPNECGVYVHLRDAFHPLVGFAYGWAALLGSLTGGLAAAAILFSGYFLSLTGVPLTPAAVAALALAILALLNALGVRQGASTQNVLTILKVAALAALIVVGLTTHPSAQQRDHLVAQTSFGVFAAFSVAMIPVLFAYLGAQVVNFVTTETKDAARALPTGLTLGMIGVALVYVLVNAACIRVLGVGGLARTDVPVTAVLSHAVGPIGARLTSIAIALTTLGFMSNRMLTVPRLYHAMAADGLFFRAVARIDPRTHVPVVAVLLQAAFAIAIALSAGYAHILNFVVAISYAFAGLLALAIFIFRARDRRAGIDRAQGFRVPWHPFSTAIFMLASWGAAAAAGIAYPRDGLLGLAVVVSAVPVYLVWKRVRFAQKARA